MEEKKVLTTNQGVPITDNQNSGTAVERGHVLLQYVRFIEKIAHFDSERIPENCFSEVEQAAFCPAAIVPGIEFSADKLLWCRHSHTRTQERYQLGTNYLQLPINRPRVPVNSDQRDGPMQIREFSGTVNYEPCSLDPDAPVEAIAGNPYTHRIEEEVTRRKIRLTDDFTQAGMWYRSFSKMEQEHLVDNLVADLLEIDRTIRQRVVGNLTNADPALGRSVAEGLKL